MPVSWGYTPIIDSSYWNIGLGDTTNYTALTPGIDSLTYTMQDGAGCIYDTTLAVFINPSPIINLGNDTAICFNENILINSGNTVPGTSYAWSNGSTSSATNVTVNTTQTYSLTATSNEGCISEDSILVEANPLPQIILSDDTLICIGTQAYLSAGGGDIFVWSNGASTASIQVAPSNSTTYSVTVTDSNACVSDSSVFVTVAPLPNISISNDTTICENTSTDIWASGGNIYQWSNGVNQSSQTVNPTSDRIYTVVVTDNNNCVDSADVQVTLLPLPIARALSDYDTLCSGGIVTLSAQGGMSYLWDNGSLSPSWEDEPTASKTYHLLAINSQNGTSCYDTASVFVYVEHCALYMPSAFTPNGDGLNDKFGPLGIVSDNAFYEFIIYDRWGSVVFKTNDKYAQWDGKKDFIDLPPGVYTYIIRVAEKSIEPYQIKGTVTLLR
jgi:gliding motility-associated-like protein